MAIHKLLTGLATPQDEIDLLAVVTDSESERIVETFAREAGFVRAAINRGNIDLAIQQLAALETAPRALIVDVSVSAMPLTDLERLAAVCEPSVSVTVIGEKNDVGLFRNLLDLGVQDYLIKPLSADLLKRSIDSQAVPAPARQHRTGKVIAVAGARGGVGASTVATFLSHRLSSVGQRRVALVDQDLNGGACCDILGLTPNNGLADALRHTDTLDGDYLRRILLRKDNRLSVLSCELDHGAESDFPAEAIRPVLDAQRKQFHYVVADIGSRMDAMAQETVASAQHIVLVADRSVHAVRKIRRFRAFMTARAPAAQFTLILNDTVPVTRDSIDRAELEQVIEAEIAAEIPYDPKYLRTAENLGDMDAARRSPVNDAMDHLAEAISGKPFAKRGGLLGLFKRG